VTVVAPKWFRRMTFTVEWVEPLRAAAAPVRDLAHDELITTEQSGAALSTALLVEAEYWMRLGQAAGYFPTNVDVEAEHRPVWVRIHLPEWPPMSASGMPETDLDALAFGRALDQARHDLTADRREHLRLTRFAPNEEWYERLEEVKQIARLFARNPAVALPDATVDRIAWSLDGAESQIADDPELPAHWRSAFAGLSQRTRRRIDEVEEVRKSIAQTALSVAGDERITAQVHSNALLAEQQTPRREQDSEEKGSNGFPGLGLGF
jgi:hypothetical protein